MGNETTIRNKEKQNYSDNSIIAINTSTRNLNTSHSNETNFKDKKNRTNLNSNCLSCIVPCISNQDIDLFDQEDITIQDSVIVNKTASDKTINTKSNELNNVQININNYFSQDETLNNENKIYTAEDSIFTNNPLDKSYFNLKSKYNRKSKNAESVLSSFAINDKSNSIESTFQLKSCFKNKGKKKSKVNLNIYLKEQNVNFIDQNNFFKVNTISICDLVPSQDLNINKHKISSNSLSKNRNNYIYGKSLSGTIKLKSSKTISDILNKDEYLSRFIQRKKTGIKTIETDEIKTPVSYYLKIVFI